MLKVIEKVGVAEVKNVALQNFGNDSEREKLVYNSQPGWVRTYPANPAVYPRSTPRGTFLSPAKRPSRQGAIEETRMLYSQAR